MKKFFSLALAGITVASALASCSPAADRLDDAITLASSDATECAEWLDKRLDTFPTEVVVGIGSNENYGVDMSDFEDDGYVLRSFGKDTLVFGATADGLDRAVRAYAKAADAGAAETLDVTYHEGVRIEKLTIADRDISEFTVVYNHDRDAVKPADGFSTIGNAMYAAEELVRLIEQATGIAIPAVPHTEKVSGPVISIDYYTEGDLGANGFTYEVKDGNLYINGVGQANGCANAVYYLLEYECGWTDLVYGDSDLQEADHVNVPEGLTKSVKPLFRQTQTYFLAQDPMVTDRDRFYRGDMIGAGHYIGTWAGRPGENFCMTDKALYLDVYDNIVDYIEANLNAGNVIGENFGHINLGMEDNTDFCKCKDCSEVFREENRTLMGVSVRFANQMASDLEDAGYEGLKLAIFSYAGCNIPCATRPADNVYITYCVNGACKNHPLDGSGCYEDSCEDMTGVMSKYYGWTSDQFINNKYFGEWTEGWGELSDNVSLYYYLLPANFAQYNYTRLLYDDLHFAAEAGITGYTPEATYLGLGLGRLCSRLIMDVIWHPEMTEAEYEVRMLEMIRREYGDGYEYIDEYLDIWTLTEQNTGCWYGWFFNQLLHPKSVDEAMYAERAGEMYALLEKAMKLCDNAKQEDRLKRLMCDVLYRECAYKYFAAYDAEDNATIAELEKKYELFVEYLSSCGYSFTEPCAVTWGFGPSARTGAWRHDDNGTPPLCDNLTDAAWIDMIRWRDELTPEGTTQRPMPEGYEPYEPNK